MEMHQVRYFLAVARTLNFTRAADECNVAQPSLTRAIKLLEGELGGDLFRRERPRAMLTSLGERMYPLLKQCYDSAQSARALAALIKDGEVGALKLAVSSSIELSLIMSHVNELRRSVNEVELKILRGPGPQLIEYMKSGEAELAIAASIGGSCSTSRSTSCLVVRIGFPITNIFRLTICGLSASCCVATARGAMTLPKCCAVWD